MPENLEAIMTRFKTGKQTLEDINNLSLLIKEGKVTLATGAGAVALGGNVSDAVIVTGNNNIVIKGSDAEAIKAALLKSHVRQFLNAILQDIESQFKWSNLLNDHNTQNDKNPRYIPIQVTLERISQHLVETPLAYSEQITELKRLYAYKGFNEEQTQCNRVDWEEAKKRYQKLIVLADPGMGKSTLLRMDAWKTAQEQIQNLDDNKISIEDVNFPVFLRLSDLAKEKDDDKIIDSISNLMTKYAAPEIFELLKKKLETGKCLVLLDALDEVPQDYRDSLRTKLNNFASTYTGKIICTSRIIGYDKTFFKSDKEVQIIPFGQNQIERYISWFINDKSVVEGLNPGTSSKPTPLIFDL